MKYHYFTITAGLRGCYMPDACSTYRMATRRELKAIIASETDMQSCDGMYAGLSKENVTWAAARAWTSGRAILPFGKRGSAKPYAIEISRATRQEYLENQENDQ